MSDATGPEEHRCSFTPRRRRDLLATCLLVASVLIAGCKGDTGPAGEDGTDGSNGSNGNVISCTATSNGDGSSTIRCTDGTSVTVTSGKDGVSCTVTNNGNGTRTITCADGTYHVVPTDQIGSRGSTCLDVAP